MEAIIISGGLGSRLLPLTERRPKHVLPVGGVPFCLHQLTKLASAGVDHVVLATSYHAEAFEPILGDGSAIGLRLSYVRERDPLGTGGAIRHAARELASGPDDLVLVLNGDQLSGHDLRAQLARAEAADVCLHLRRVADPRAFGCVPTDDHGRLTGFLEKSPDPVTDQVNAGCYAFRRKVIDCIPAGEVVSVERQTFPELVAAGANVVGHVDQAYWRDVGNPDSLVGASVDLVQGRVSSPAYAHAPADRLVQDGAEVAADAVVHGGSVIGSGAVIGPGSRVSGSLVMPGARIEAGAHVIDSVVGPAAQIGARALLEGAAVGDDAIVGPGARLDAGTRVACGAYLPGD